MNGFLNTELFKKFLHDYNFLVDPGYLDSTDSKRVKLVRGDPEVRVASSTGVSKCNPLNLRSSTRHVQP